MRIALLGCTGQIGRGLARLLDARHDLVLYARRPEAMQSWAATRGLSARIMDLTAFPEAVCDLVINAIGDGAPGRIRAAGSQILETTERYDRLCLDHLDRTTAGAYIFLSTGRVYGEDYGAARAAAPQPLPQEAFRATEFYPLAKRRAELRHGARAHQRIADVRIFGYVSDEIALEDDFIVAQMLRAMVDGVVFLTQPRDFVRDYVGPGDLIGLIDRLVASNVANGAYDLCSARPTTKFELLHALAERCGLRYSVEGTAMPYRNKPERISHHTAAQAIGYVPGRTSLENVVQTAVAIAGRPRTRIRSIAI